MKKKMLITGAKQNKPGIINEYKKIGKEYENSFH
jgi:hypothetical protein